MADEHIGSTAVPGLAAKPIIDLMVGVLSLADGQSAVLALEALGKLFRDYLLSHPDEAHRYETLKRNLAARFSTDREGYTNGKSEYIQAVMEKARRKQIV